MEKSSLIPVRSSDLSISKFDQESYYIHQTKFDLDIDSGIKVLDAMYSKGIESWVS